MELKKLIEIRRAYRSLDPVIITDGQIEEAMQRVQLTPSCFNNQPWRFIFVRDKTRLDTLKTALNKGNEWAHDSSMIIAVYSKRDLDCKIPPARDYFLFDTGMASFNLILTLTEMGLVAHPIAGYDEIKSKEILQIPEEFQIITLIIVGRHSSEMKPSLNEKQRETEVKRPDRKSTGDLFKYDVFSL